MAKKPKKAKSRRRLNTDAKIKTAVAQGATQSNTDYAEPALQVGTPYSKRMGREAAEAQRIAEAANLKVYNEQKKKRKKRK